MNQPHPSSPSSNKPRSSKLRLVNVPPPRSLTWKLISLAGWAALVGATAVVFGVLFLYYKYSEGLPEIPKVEAYAPPVVSEVFTDDQVLAGEFYNERRKVVPYEHIPKRLVQAF